MTVLADNFCNLEKREQVMKTRINWVRAGVLMLAAMAVSTTGCVFVVGGDGAKRGADVEWASDRNAGVTPARVATTSAQPADGMLAREVDARMRIDSALSREDITVSSTGDVVTLHGRVTDIGRLEHAMRVAADVPGVARVVSRLTVEMEAG